VADGAVIPAIAIPGLVLLAVVLAFNLFVRIRRPGVVRRLTAVGMIPVDAVLVLLESVWIVLMAAVGVVGGAARLVLQALGSALRFVLWPLLRGFDLAFGWLTRSYPVLLRASLRRRAPVLVLAAATLGAALWGLGRSDTALIPEVHQGEFDLEVALPVGTPIEETLLSVAPIEAWALDDPRIEGVVLQVGADPDADAGPEEGEHTARVSMRLAPAVPGRGMARIGTLLGRIADGIAHAGSGGAVAVREEEVIADLRASLRGMPDLQAKITRPVLFSFRTPVEVEVEAYDLDTLRRVGETVRAELESVSFLTDVKSTARAGSPEVQITYDRNELIRRGLDVRAVAELVRTKIRGSSATEYRKRERRIDVVVRLAEGDRATVRQLRNVVVNPGSPVPIPLSAVADVRIAAGPADIRRVGQTRVALIQANLAGGGLGRAEAAIRERLDALDLPPRTTWRIAGQVQEMQRSLGSLWIALGLSVFLVYVVMASQFESLVHPLLIMVTVPLAFVGVVALLVWLAVPLSVVVFLGMIMLAGIVVNNAIVLVDYVNRLRRRGRGLEDALVEAGSARLRPILMTTATTVLGLLPMSLGLGDGAEIRTPMALTVIAGLVSSTVLTLIVLPTLYAAADGVLRRTEDADA
jgi:HAE1 family hydrophobic/amphiphilic exporter-1